MAPEYALWGYLTHKADVYSFGVVALEIVSGKSNNNYVPSDNCICLLDWVKFMHTLGLKSTVYCIGVHLILPNFEYIPAVYLIRHSSCSNRLW